MIEQHDFTLHFLLPVSEPADTALPARERERAFAADQIRTLLAFVTLYQNGRQLAPDSFSIVNAPSRVHPLELVSTTGEEEAGLDDPGGIR